MKKLIVFALMWVLTLAIPFALMAQSSSEVIPPVLNLQVYFGTLGAFAAIIIPATSLLIRLFKIEIKWIKQVLSWIVSLVLGLLAMLLNLGIFTDVVWYIAILYSFVAGLIANGIFNIELVKSFLRLVGLEPNSKAI